MFVIANAFHYESVTIEGSKLQLYKQTTEETTSKIKISVQTIYLRIHEHDTHKITICKQILQNTSQYRKKNMKMRTSHKPQTKPKKRKGTRNTTTNNTQYCTIVVEALPGNKLNTSKKHMAVDYI